jgi:hypothetical protein
LTPIFLVVNMSKERKFLGADLVHRVILVVTASSARTALKISQLIDGGLSPTF